MTTYIKNAIIKKTISWLSLRLVETKKFQSISQKAEEFFYSNLYIALITIIGIIGFVLRVEIYSIFAIILIVCLSWIFCEDIMPSFVAVAILAMAPLARHGEVNFFNSLYYAPIIIVPSFIFHIIAFPPKIKLNRFFYTTTAVAIAITLGGLFYLKASEYFSMPALYYVIGLGFGMVFIYLVLQAYIPKDQAKIADYFARMMVGIGIMGIAMIIFGYISNKDLFERGLSRLANGMQWRNNLSNNLLLSMPFAFYLATKGKHSTFYFVVGILQYLAMVLSLSRGGMIFGSLVFPFVLVITLIIAKKDRKKLFISLFIIVGLIVLVYFIWARPLFKNVLEHLEVRSNEARTLLYKLAYRNFLEYPIFGKGLAYNGGMYYYPQPWCIYWYHSTLFQILGSLGIVGLLAYGYQEIMRFNSLIRVKSRFNLFALLAMVGFAGYSMVNVGYFAPLPFVAMVVHLFLVVERYNNILKEDKDLMLTETILNKQ